MSQSRAFAGVGMGHKYSSNDITWKGDVLHFGRRQVATSAAIALIEFICRSKMVPRCTARGRAFQPWLRFLVALPPRAGLVTLGQTFVRRSHGGNCPPWDGQDERWDLFSPEF